MTYVFDGSMNMWSTLIEWASYTIAFGYGAWRREHTRFWPIPSLGVILDSLMQICLGSNSLDKPNMYLGALLYTMYCMVACVAGIMGRVLVETTMSTRGKDSRTDGKFPPHQV